MLLKINDKIINMDRVGMIERKAGGSVWLHFEGRVKGSPDADFSIEESAKIWDYLAAKATDVMAFEGD